MTTERKSLGAEYFDKLYKVHSDPWHFATSPYEREKYRVTLDALKGKTFLNVLEVGCSIGILTRQLAACSRSLLAVDISEMAITRAWQNCKDLLHVTFRKAQIPSEWPDGVFDLILFSEILYFLSPEDIRLTAECCIRALTRDGLVLLINWTGETDYPCGGDEGVAYFAAACGRRLRMIQHRRELKYRLDLFESNAKPARSIA
jgi:2-polyprenyl-3-methyl-5-hydroxy-6-metoxy-1,4-benzoquinol methylase